VTDISWGRITSPHDYFSIGDKIKVIILSFDRETQRVALGYKQLKTNPWELVQQKFPVDTRITGKVVNITNYGCFIELEEGVEGLIHISEMSWTKKVKHPSQLLSIGDVIEAVVLDMDVPRKRISLGLKQLEPNPWSMIEERYPVGTVVEGKIKNIADFGIFIGLDEGIDGLVHISDISWVQKIKHPSELYKKGEMVKAVVLSIDKDKERFSLGIKQLEPDPWEDVPNKYRRGQVVKGVVTNITDFGIFLEIEEGVEGLVHVSEISEDKVKNMQEVSRVGEELEVLIISIDKRNRKIGLSLRELLQNQEEQNIQDYMQGQGASGATIGDVMLGSQTDTPESAAASEPEVEAGQDSDDAEPDDAEPDNAVKEE
jgi:small subunit ribosomal protein S1